MKLATREQILRIDELAETKFGLSQAELIESAGHALARFFVKVAGAFEISKRTNIGVWCGPGNNGADGKVMAKVLHEDHWQVQVVTGFDWDPTDFDVIVDAYFGVGLKRPLNANTINKIKQINTSAAKVFAIDLPSGLDANTGETYGAAAKAVATFTIYPPKPGLFLNCGPGVAGKIYSVDIHLPLEIFSDAALLDTVLVNRRFVSNRLPQRSSSGNKSRFGHLLVIAGSSGMEGAAAMVCDAASRMGCGYVTLCSSSERIAAFVKPDFLSLRLDNFFASDLKKYDAVVVGPGLGRSDLTLQILQHLVQNHSKVLVDADALSVVSEHWSCLPGSWILTPHAGELGRLTGVAAKLLEADRLKAATSAQNKWKATILFKGFRTVLRNSRQSFVIYSGNVALAKAGTGDVLAGFIGSLMAQGLNTDEAGVIGAYLHGRIADDWKRRGGSNRTLMASDLPTLLDACLSRLKKKR